MPELAQVIVDVPTMQTNRPYTYQIPDRLSHQVKIGMRVIVPFGKGQREVQGFIVGLDEPTSYDGQLKPLSGLMDLTPVVNPELLELSKWMADDTYSFWISCIYTMLPNVLKAQSKRVVRIVDEIDEQTSLNLFKGGDELDFADVQNDPDAVSQLLKLRRAGKIRFEYQVVDRAKVKMVTTITPAMDFLQLEDVLHDLRKNAKVQQRLAAYLQNLQGHTVTLMQAEKESGLNSAAFSMGMKKGWLKKGQIERYRIPDSGRVPSERELTKPLKLTHDQEQVLAPVVKDIDQEQAQTFLLRGVTGSGKTEVYLHAIAHALKKGQSALLLVPEISLTPQIVDQVRGRFGKQVAVIHSALSSGERYDEWRRIERGEASVVVGARSAVFAPLKNIGIIIMDEEHESSYKQDDVPRYHARKVAKWRSRYHHCPLLLGSATPSLESYARAMAGNYQLLTLAHRINQQPLPPIQVIDMRPEIQARGESNFSTELLSALNDRLQKHEQSILMLNRRGFSSFMMCRSCGYVLKCPNCDISLTMHLDTHTMKCHYCGHEEPIPSVCPNCHSRQIRYYGTGTEKVAMELHHLLPQARVIRMDVDTTRRKGMHGKLLREFGNHEADILLGTQMIAKGLDFPNVTLVGVLNADTGLDIPDFRASERTFDLLSQVSGRAGRADKKGQVIIQTFNPDNYAIRLAQAHDYDHFFATEMNIRSQAGYPPYFYTVKLMASHPEEKEAAKVIYDLKAHLTGLAKDTIILGPTPRAIARLKRRYYYQIIIKYRHDPALHQCLTKMLQYAQQQYPRDVELVIDPDPQYFL
ncbi:primosomal protein N' [Limosilactobacillus secaliphilus]|uniref:Replication restart protein PriA n=1 Tax=Limosilactobacillus secaliphilus TaxID=396268 RepID=A0A0R2I1P7_9LACO|nr:primosomal protein N' [Limosilactobacillus secaliphilus]KRN59107.1 primosomal replication protein n [Limosilactobacillus secaliphilus]